MWGRVCFASLPPRSYSAPRLDQLCIRPGATVPTNLSIKNAPDDIVNRLKRRAARNHRSLQGELLAILDEAVGPESPLTPAAVLDETRRLGLSTPGEAAAMIRKDRGDR